MPTLRNVIGLWRAPEQVASSAVWSAQQASLTDVYLFGEAGLFGARRGADGAPAAIKPGPHGAPRELPGSSIAGEILLTPRGTLALRGPMVTVAAYAPPPPPSDSLIAAPPRDYVDTDYSARLDRATGTISITAPPSGIMAVGGYRFLRAGSAGMGQAPWPGGAVDGAAGPDERPSSGRPRPGQCPRPRGALRTRP